MAAFSATGARPAFAAAVVLVFDEQPESKRALIRITGIVLKYYIHIGFLALILDIRIFQIIS